MSLETFESPRKSGLEKSLERIKKQGKTALGVVLIVGTLNGGMSSCDSPEKNRDSYIIIDANNYWKNEGWFDAAFHSKLPREILSSGVEIIRDRGMCFYVVKKGDSLSSIREKLSKIEEFSYLKDLLYTPKDKSRNINSFNIPANELKPWLFIPIPLAKEQRTTSDREFYQMSLDAIEELQSNSIYWSAIQKILDDVSKEEIAQTMCAYARAETAQDWERFSDDIGSVTLHRWEPHMKAFSFSHYHILMEKNADWKTHWPGLRARQKLKLTEGQTYHPKNWGKLFLAYWIEKNKNLKNPLNLADVFKMRNEADARKFGKIYNGDANYGEKLWKNHQYFKKVMQKE